MKATPAKIPETAGESPRSAAFFLALAIALGAAVFSGTSFLRSISGIDALVGRELADISTRCRAMSAIGADLVAVDERFAAARRDLTAGPGVMRATVAAISYDLEKIRNRAEENAVAAEITQFEVILGRYEDLVRRLARDLRQVNAEYLELARLAERLRALIGRAGPGQARRAALLDLDRALFAARKGVETMNAAMIVATGREPGGGSFTAVMKDLAAGLGRLRPRAPDASGTAARMLRTGASLATAIRKGNTHADLLERTSTPFRNAIERFNRALPERLLSIRARSAEHLQWARYIVFALAAALVSAMVLAQASITMRNRDQARRRHRLERALEQVREERDRIAAELRRLEAENRELRKSAETWRDLFENASDMIQILAPDGRFLHTNHAWRRALGYSEEDLETMTVFDIIHPDCRGHCMKLFAGMDSGEVMINTTMVAKDGRRVEVEGHANLRVEDGRAVSTRCILRDVTAQRRVEAEAAKAMRLEGLALMSGGLAHDLNNLLTAVTGNLSLIKAYGGGDEKIAAKVEQSEKALARAGDMLDRLLDFSRIEEPRVRPTRIEPVVREAAELIAAGRGCVINWLVEQDLPEVEIDPGQIGQVVQNLVANAAQAMDGGLVEIAIRPTIVTRESNLPLLPGDYLEIRVRDFGPGLPPDRLERVFEPYFTTKKAGRGLGLAVSYAMIRKHNGLLCAENHRDGGAVFSIYLPIPQAGGTK